MAFIWSFQPRKTAPLIPFVMSLAQPRQTGSERHFVPQRGDLMKMICLLLDGDA